MTDNKQSIAEKKPSANTTASHQTKLKPSQTKLKATTPKTNSLWNKRLLWLLLVVIVVALVVAYQNWQLKQQIGLVNSLHSEVTSLQISQAQGLQSLQQEITALNNQLTQQKTLLAEQEGTMDATLERAIQQLAQQQRQTHQQLPKLELAEAEYLLRLANQRLNIEQKPEKVAPLLQAADEIMRTSQQIGSFGVRKAIAKDLIALNNSESIDRHGIYAQLSGLVTLTEQLRYSAPTALVLHTTPTTKNTSSLNTTALESQEPSLWQTAQQKVIAIATNIWLELKDLIRIKERSASDKILLSPDTEQLVRLRLQLLFNQSQTALMQDEPHVYLQALQQAETILQQYYRSSDTVTQSMLNALNELQSINIKPTMPSIIDSLRALQALQTNLKQAQE